MNNKNNEILEYVLPQSFNVRGGLDSSHQHTILAYDVLKTRKANYDYAWESLARCVDTPKIPYFHQVLGRNEVSLEDYIKFLKEVTANNKDENAEVCFKSYVGTRFYNEMLRNIAQFESAPYPASETDATKRENVLTVQVPAYDWIFKDAITGKINKKVPSNGVDNCCIKIDSKDTASILAVKIALQNALATSENPNNYNTMVGQQYADHTQQEDLHAIISGRGC